MRGFRERLYVFVSCLLFCAAPAVTLHGAEPVPADDATYRAAQKIYDDLFGKAERAALATVDKADDRTLAAELNRYAAGMGVANADDRAAKQLLLERVYLLARHDVTAADLASQAATALATLDARNADYWRERVALVAERKLRAKAAAPGATAADRRAAVTATLTRMVSNAQEAWAGKEYSKAAYAFRRAARLAAQVKSTDPDPKALDRQADVAAARVFKQAEARRLQDKLAQPASPAEEAAARVRALLLLVDDPDAAGDALGGSKGATLGRIVPLAKIDASALTAEQAKELGDWYWSFAGAADHVASKQVVSSRVAACLERRIELSRDVTERRRLEAALRSARRLTEKAAP